jgi:putative transposase
MKMIEKHNQELPVSTQCKLLGLCRSSLYYNALINSDSEIANLIREIYLKSDCRYGYRKITAGLKANYELVVNHKKVLRIMQDMKIQGIYPRKFINTTIKDNNAIFPYLLNGVIISHVDHVWATDITYISLPGRFMYFIAIIDLYSRYIIAYELSSSLEATFCIDTLKSALLTGHPEIFNTDQGSQFTSNDFVDTLRNHDVKISMDHKGRCFDNIFVERLWRTLKQEAIYYYRPDTIPELEKCIHEFVFWYNEERLHQSLNYKTPKNIYTQSCTIH